MLEFMPCARMGITSLITMIWSEGIGEHTTKRKEESQNAWLCIRAQAFGRAVKVKTKLGFSVCVRTIVQAQSRRDA